MRNYNQDDDDDDDADSAASNLAMVETLPNAGELPSPEE